MSLQDDEDEDEPKGLNGSLKSTVTALSNICNILGTFSQVRALGCLPGSRDKVQVHAVALQLSNPSFPSGSTSDKH